MTLGTPGGVVVGTGCGIDAFGHLVIAVDGEERVFGSVEVTGVDRG